MELAKFIPPLIALIAAPLLPGIINRTKAFFAGRHGQPILQLYYDIFKLIRMGSTYSQTTTWVFRAAPMLGLAAIVTALAFVPMGGTASPLFFSGDLLLFVYLLCIARFFTIVAALDTGSSFEGMGASREALFSAISEPVVLLSLAAIAYSSHNTSLSGMYEQITPAMWMSAAPSLVLIVLALGTVLLVECSRIPVDDPNTHLELTMIHEVMVLDSSGPDFAMISYAASLKLWVFGALVVGIAVPVRTGFMWLDCGIFVLGMMVIAVLIGIIESSMARLRLTNVPRLIVGAIASSVLAWALILR